MHLFNHGPIMFKLLLTELTIYLDQLMSRAFVSMFLCFEYSIAVFKELKKSNSKVQKSEYRIQSSSNYEINTSFRVVLR